MAHSKSKNFLFGLGVIFALILLCYSLPEALLFWRLCWKQDHNLPPNTEVIVSACQRPSAFGVPGGETLLVYRRRGGDNYLLDLRTGEKKTVPDDSLLLDHGVFLSSELVWLEGSSGPPESTYYRPHYILDLSTGQRYELLDLDWLPRLEDGHFDPKNFAYIRSADQVFIHHSKNTLIALSADFRDNPNGRVIFSQSSLASFNEGYSKGELLAKLMDDLGMDYEIVDFSLKYSDVPSPAGKYIVHGGGIHHSKTNTPVVIQDMGFYFRSWYYDESGVVFQEAAGYLINFPEARGYYPIPTPILKLHLP